MKILLAALISEGFLVLLSLVLKSVFELRFDWNFTFHSVALGILLTLPPLCINHLLWSYSQRASGSIYARFSKEIIIPLCRNVTWRMAVLIALLSGVCEELFFRGALNSLSLRYLGPLVSCLLTSMVFAGVHFIGSFKRYGMMIPLYSAMGAYLWVVHSMSESLTAVAVLHGVYNFTVIMLVKRSIETERRSQMSVTQTSSAPHE
jgi:membrane protease YdiL (CAAX protease family)